LHEERNLPKKKYKEINKDFFLLKLPKEIIVPFKA